MYGQPPRDLNHIITAPFAATPVGPTGDILHKMTMVSYGAHVEGNDDAGRCKDD